MKKSKRDIKRSKRKSRGVRRNEVRGRSQDKRKIKRSKRKNQE